MLFKKASSFPKIMTAVIMTSSGSNASSSAQKSLPIKNAQLWNISVVSGVINSQQCLFGCLDPISNKSLLDNPCHDVDMMCGSWSRQRYLLTVAIIMSMDLPGASFFRMVTMHSLKTSASVNGLLCLESTQAACRDAHVTLSWSVKAQVIIPLAWEKADFNVAIFPWQVSDC